MYRFNNTEYKICEVCGVNKHNAKYDRCFTCNGLVTVVYDLSKDANEKKAYFAKYPGYWKKDNLPAGVVPNSDNEVYASDLLKKQ